MQPDAAALLWDARRAAELVLDFVAGRTWLDYQADPMLRSAVERQFEIIGESLNRLSRADPLTAAGVQDLPRIVAFRNVLVHGYATIDDVLVWEVATTRIVMISQADREGAWGSSERMVPSSPETAHRPPSATLLATTSPRSTSSRS
jgi:uncharacterized protein with HEPN domain